jgi:hypothetical protein
MRIVNGTPAGDEDMTAGPIGRHRVAVAGVWDYVRRNRGTTAVGAGYPPRIDLTSSARIVAAVRCPVLTRDVDSRASAGGSSDSGSVNGRRSSVLQRHCCVDGSSAGRSVPG